MYSYTSKMTVKELMPFVEIKDSNKLLEASQEKDEIIKKALAGDFIVSLVFSAKDSSTIIFGDDMMAVLKAFVSGKISYCKSKKQPEVYFKDLPKTQKKQILNYEINVMAYEISLMDTLRAYADKFLKTLHLVPSVPNDDNTEASPVSRDVNCIISLDILKCLPKYKLVEAD